GAHRDLPSFPTRRSSDLIRNATATSNTITAEPPPIHQVLDQSPALLVGFSFRATAAGWRTTAGAARTSARGGIGGAWRGLGSRGDRKSTRLNSSHVKISY